VSLAGYVGFGQILATLADRYGRISVMLVADVARAVLFAMMLLPVPVGVLLLLAFLAGLATPPFEAARSAALPDLVPEHRYGDALALSGISVQMSLVVGYALGGLLLSVVQPAAALFINACTFLVSAALLLRLRGSAASHPAVNPTTVTRSLSAGFYALFGDRMVRRALCLVAVTGALGTVAEALVVPYAVDIGFGDKGLGLLAAAVPVGTLLATAVIATGSRDHHTLLRTAGWCAAVTAGLAAPLFWLEVTGALAFVAFATAGGIFAISIPTNTVVGVRLTRDARASAMGIAVGVLMGCQAIGAMAGGLAATIVGAATATAMALTATAIFGVWAVITTPFEAKHLLRVRRRTTAPDVVVDLLAFEHGNAPAAPGDGAALPAEPGRPPGAEPDPAEAIAR
jgi:MFS family permease